MSQKKKNVNKQILQKNQNPNEEEADDETDDTPEYTEDSSDNEDGVEGNDYLIYQRVPQSHQVRTGGKTIKGKRDKPMDTTRQKRRSYGDQEGPARKRAAQQQGTLGRTSTDSAMKDRHIEANKKHNELYIRLDDLITESLFKRIKRMSRSYLTPKTWEKVNDMEELLSCLEEKYVIGVGKYNELIEIIKLAGAVGGDIIPIIRQTAKDIEDIMQVHIPGQGQRAESSRETQLSYEGSIHPSPAFTKGRPDNDILEHLTSMIEQICIAPGIRKRMGTSCSEVPAKIRPESDGLRQLKNQTENNLDTFREMGFIPTIQTEEAKKLLLEKRSLVIKGNPGEGKTSTALHLIDNDDYRNRRVVVQSPKQWRKVDTDWVEIVVLDNIFGKYDLDPRRLEEWIDDHLGTIQNHVDVGKLQVIIVTRNDILLKASSKLKSFKLFSSSMSLTLSSDKLTNSDKKSILNRELQRNKKDLNVNEIEQCILNFSGLIGFPQCCYLFAGNKDFFDKGIIFFKSPENFLVENIRNVKANSFLSLAFLFCNGKIEEEYLSPSQVKQSESYLPLLKELALHLGISFNESTIISLRESYDHFAGLYVNKKIEMHKCSGGIVRNSCIQFFHSTVYEAVGQVLGERCPEIVVKYGDSAYLYQRTYTAEAKDSTSQNVFIPVSVSGLLFERMFRDVVEKGLIGSVVKHSALKQNDFVMKLKDVLHKSERIMDFFMAKPYSLSRFGPNLPEQKRDLSDGMCITSLQYILQSDEDVVRLMYSQFLEFLVCTHSNQNSDCWQCVEKQKLLELSLYYHHFEIADRLTTMNACYTHVSLCNAARHGDLSRVLTILETLKMCGAFNAECYEAKAALFRAYISGNQSLIDILLKEWITLDRWHIVDAVQYGDINVLMKVVEHLKYHTKWNPYYEQESTHWEQDIPLDQGRQWTDFLHPKMYFSSAKPLFQSEIPCTIALYITYCLEKFDMADYLLKCDVRLPLYILPHVTKYGSMQAVDSVIQTLKLTGTWDPQCDKACEALLIAYTGKKYDLYNMLIKEGVTFTIKEQFSALLESNKACVQQVKDIAAYSSVSLENDFLNNLLYLINNSAISMPNIPEMQTSLIAEVVHKFVQPLKDVGSLDPNHDDASDISSHLSNFVQGTYDVCEMAQEEHTDMWHFRCMVIRLYESVNNLLQNLEETDSTYDAYIPHMVNDALSNVVRLATVDPEDLQAEKMVSNTMKNMVLRSLDDVKAEVARMKDDDSWDPRCNYASEALEFAYNEQKYDVCDLLVQEGISLTMKNLTSLTRKYMVSLESVKNIIERLKYTNCWDPKCNEASEALHNSCIQHNYDVLDLLVHEGVSQTMKSFPEVVLRPLDYVKTAVRHLKNTCSWEPKSDYASKALANAYSNQKFDVSDLLVQEGVSLSMKDFPHMAYSVSLKSVKIAIQHLKDSNNWDHACDDAYKALKIAYRLQNYDMCDLLVQEGIFLTMKNFPDMILRDCVMTAVEHLKYTDSWHPKCDDASEALANAYRHQRYDVCDLLIKEGVSLTMKNLPSLVLSLESVKKTIEHLKDADNWDPECDDASEALENAYAEQKYDVCDLLVQEGVSLSMKNLPAITFNFMISLVCVKKAIKHLKDSHNWDPESDDASKALENAYTVQKYDVCDLLVQEGVLLTMKNLPTVTTIFDASLKSVKKVIQLLKDTSKWDPKCDDASEALANAYGTHKYDVCDLLIHEGVLLTMKNLPTITLVFPALFESVKKAIQHLKDNDNWDPSCDDASKALGYVDMVQEYDLCNLLIEEGVSLTMKTFPHVILTLASVQKAIQLLKDTHNWDPKCDDASEALANAYWLQQYNVCDLLIQLGVSLKMKNLPDVVSSLESVKNSIEHLKDTDNWDPTCDHASEALARAYSEQKYDVCHLLISLGVSLTMKNLPGVVSSLESVKKALKHLKDNDKWNPKCHNASEALGKAFSEQKYDVCDWLVQEGVSNLK